MRKRISKQTAVEVPIGVEAVDNKQAHLPSREDTPPATVSTLLHKQPYLEAMAAATPDTMIALDANYHVLDLNPAATTLLGYSAQEAIGHGCAEILRCCNLNRMELCGTASCPLSRVLYKKKALANEDLLLGLQPEHTREVSASVTPVEVEGGQYVVCL